MVFLLDVDFMGSLEISAPVGESLSFVRFRAVLVKAASPPSGFEWLSSLVQRQPGAPYNAPGSVLGYCRRTLQLPVMCTTQETYTFLDLPEASRACFFQKA